MSSERGAATGKAPGEFHLGTLIQTKGISMSQPSDLELLAAMRSAAAASLAGGIIAASGRAWSIEQALFLARDVQFAVYPHPGDEAYEAWKKDSLDRLTFVQT